MTFCYSAPLLLGVYVAPRPPPTPQESSHHTLPTTLRAERARSQIANTQPNWAHAHANPCHGPRPCPYVKTIRRTLHGTVPVVTLRWRHVRVHGLPAHPFVHQRNLECTDCVGTCILLHPPHHPGPAVHFPPWPRLGVPPPARHLQHGKPFGGLIKYQAYDAASRHPQPPSTLHPTHAARARGCARARATPPRRAPPPPPRTGTPPRC